jgi:tetratricopeptide (TPR) repeat protein
MKGLVISILLFGLFACKHESAEEYFKQAKQEIRVEKKMELLTKAIEIKPDYIEAIYQRGFVEADLSISLIDIIKEKMAKPGTDTLYYKKSLEDFKIVLKMDSNYAAAYFKRGIVEHWMGDTIQSCIDLNKAYKLKYDCSDAIHDFCR